jgi:hypothetical protein
VRLIFQSLELLILDNKTLGLKKTFTIVMMVWLIILIEGERKSKQHYKIVES